jgi:hypothetical protein
MKQRVTGRNNAVRRLFRMNTSVRDRAAQVSHGLLLLPLRIITDPPNAKPTHSFFLCDNLPYADS